MKCRARRMAFVRLLVLLVLCCVLTSGCTGGREIEEYLFPIMLGLDAAGDHQLQLTVKALSGNTGASGSDDAQSKGGDTGYITLSATGDSYVQALSLLRATLPRTLNLSQLREVVISQHLAQSNSIAPLLSELLRYNQMNGSAALVICAGRAQEVLEKQQAYVGTRVSRYLEILLSQYQEKGTIPRATLLGVSRAFADGASSPAAIYVAVNDFSAALPPPADDTLDTLPGHLDRESPNPVEYMGSAVFAHGKMAGTLTGAQTQMLRMLTGDFTALEYSVDGTVYLLRRLLPTRRSIHGDTLQSHLFLVARTLDGIPISEPDALAQALSRDAQSLMETLLSLRSDAAGFGRTQLLRHLTQESWQTEDWPAHYARCSAQAQVSLFTPR